MAVKMPPPVIPEGDDVTFDFNIKELPYRQFCEYLTKRAVHILNRKYPTYHEPTNYYPIVVPFDGRRIHFNWESRVYTLRVWSIDEHVISDTKKQLIGSVSIFYEPSNNNSEEIVDGST